MKIEVIASKRGYIVSEEGILYNPKGKEIGNYINNCGYYTTSIKINGKKYDLRTHRLQAFQKYGNKLYEEEIMVRHKNGIKLDNSKKNILIGTSKENQMDIPKSIRIFRASNPKYDHKIIIEDKKNGMSYENIMTKHNIPSKGTVSFIINKSLKRININNN